MATDTQDNKTEIAANIASVTQRINRAARKAGRNPDLIQLLCVSKTKPVSDILVAYNSGHLNFGENYVQEALEKIQSTREYSDILWHFIGPLQSNKSKFIAEHFDWMHSLDRLKIAKRLNDQRSPHQDRLQVCVQVNIDDEDSKSGVHPDNAIALIEALQNLPYIQCRGLMTIPKAKQNTDKRRESYQRMQMLFEQCAQKFDNFDTLSMGMSDDLDIAIEYGATIVRIGTDIFGKRA